MEKLICSACKAENENSAKFCTKCGVSFEEVTQFQSSKKCPKCDAELKANAVFCSECGANQNTDNGQEYGAQEFNIPNSRYSQEYKTKNEPQQATETVAESDELLMRAYITGSIDPFAENRHYKHYKVAFIKCEKNNSKVGWNWGAFWLGNLNFMYRKSYLWRILISIVHFIFCISIVLSIGATGDEGISIIYYSTSLLSMFPFGMYADVIYYSRYREKITLAKNIYPNDIARQISFMACNGGSNTVFPVMLFLATLALFCIMVAATTGELYV